MQRGAVLLGVVALLALWSLAAADLYDWNDQDVRYMALYTQALMTVCARANKYIDNPWSMLSLEAFKEKSRYHAMVIEMVRCLNHYLQKRHEIP
uniref:Conopeptide n=1 Tax=Conus lenavati TaxID=1519839 RepID=A0A0K8TUX3_CONLV